MNVQELHQECESLERNAATSVVAGLCLLGAALVVLGSALASAGGCL